ncbi:hypothetical protein LL06_08565 [Hoeflea sp. BAL378]|uniref:hypothetical protein n=1 Tax=Hoeflea sp. BAL378 TaxID=1547437 RepID=UPI0005137A3E|nr:hypothetical protein [Hoeflea sp. BAL378]KGF69862.1 hypothetical protein LL06_08565 [Hoeflea sp. BAL378]
MIRRVLSVVVFAGFFVAPALADQLPIDGNYGNEAGCQALADPTSIADSKIIVTAQKVDFYESSCDFLQVLTGSYGRSVVTALCAGEGQDWISTYLVAPDIDTPVALHFTMQGSDEFQFTVMKCE